LNTKVYFIAIRANIITSHEADLHLARLFEHGDKENQSFVLNLLTECCVESNYFCVYTEFLHTIGSIQRLVLENGNRRSSENAQIILKKLESRMSVNLLKDCLQDEDFRKKIENAFNEWVEISSHPGIGLDYQQGYVKKVFEINKLLNFGIIENDTCVNFTRICLEASIKAFLLTKPIPGSPEQQFVAIDSCARLLVLMIKNHQVQGETEQMTQYKLTSKIVSVIVLALVNSHEQGQFDQKPFYRLFSSIFNELKEFQMDMPETCSILAVMRYFIFNK
jgi:CCR4-NOT transcription complex subunit 1